jgi:hypothetical protein
MSKGTLENAMAIAKTSASTVTNGLGKSKNLDIIDKNRHVEEPPKEMIVTRLAMGLKPEA